MAEPITTVAPLEKGGIRFSETELAEVDQGRPVLRVRRERIQHIQLRWGSRAARPLVQVLLGTVFLATGCVIQGLMLWEWLRNGGVIHVEVVVGLAILALMGGWLLFDALKKGYFLEVSTDSRKEKLRFDRRLSLQKIESLLAEARQRFGYTVVGLNAAPTP